MNLEHIKALDFVEYSKIYKALLHKKKIETQIEELQLELEEQNIFIDKSLANFKTSKKVLIVIPSEEKEENLQVANWFIPVNAQVKVCNVHGIPVIEACNSGIDMAVADGANFIFFLENNIVLPSNILQTLLDLSIDGKTIVSDFSEAACTFAPTSAFINNKLAEGFSKLAKESGYKLLLYNFKNLP